jgi:hypothetical protein
LRTLNFLFDEQHTIDNTGHVMRHNTQDGRTGSGAGFLTLCGEILAVLLIFAMGALLLAL